MSADPHRPTYHFLPPANWMNDPNGLIQWRGQYHLFYQHNPAAPQWGSIHWGHAASADLLHWEHLPIALSPGPQEADREGCWSGVIVDDNGVPTALYTGAPDQRPCLARGSDDLLRWEKHPGNPVIPTPPGDMELVGFRDHTVWREGGFWFQGVGAGIVDEGGAVLLYRSPDLVKWEYQGILCYVFDLPKPTSPWATGMWECPDFFALDGRHYLAYSAHDPILNRGLASVYLTGEYRGGQFYPQQTRMMDHGGAAYYAPQSFVDDRGRRIQFGWIQESRPPQAQTAAGWSGVMSLPRELGALPDGTLSIQPAAELEALRGKVFRFGAQSPRLGRAIPLAGVQGAALEAELEVEWEPSALPSAVGLAVRCAPAEAERTEIWYDPRVGRLWVDRSRSTLDPAPVWDQVSGPLELAPGEPLRLRVFLDASVVEIFANGRFCLTTRIYPTRGDALGMELLAGGPGVKVRSLTVWELAL